MKRFQIGLMIAMLATSFAGCGGSTTQSVFDESEMAKYRSTPEEIEQARQAAMKSAAPSQADIQRMANEAKQAAAGAAP